jgi:hypothetical protein
VTIAKGGTAHEIGGDDRSLSPAWATTVFEQSMQKQAACPETRALWPSNCGPGRALDRWILLGW